MGFGASFRSVIAGGVATGVGTPTRQKIFVTTCESRIRMSSIHRPPFVLGLVVFVVFSAGCAGLAEDTTQSTTMAPTSSETTATPTATTTTMGVASSMSSTIDRPDKGDNLLSLTRVNESTAMTVNLSQRASVGNLTDAQREVVHEALNCDCNVNQEVFTFNDEDRLQYVTYNGTWYYLRVAIV